jgi:hypothetical protein
MRGTKMPLKGGGGGGGGGMLELGCYSLKVSYAYWHKRNNEGKKK